MVPHESTRCYRLRKSKLRPATQAQLSKDDDRFAMKAGSFALMGNGHIVLESVGLLLAIVRGLWPRRMWSIEAIDEGPSREVYRWRVHGWQEGTDLLAKIRHSIEEAEPFPAGSFRQALPPLYHR